MKKLYRQLALGLSLSMIVSFEREVPAQSADITRPDKDPCAKYNIKQEQQDNIKQEQQAAESIRLYYLRSAETIQEILKKVIDANACIKGTMIEAQGDNTIVLYGYPTQRKELERIIALLDLPRERVNMEMWGILISSDSPEQIAEVMGRINREIDQTRQDMQETYQKLEILASKVEIDPDFKYLFEEVLGYKDALNNDRPSFSMTDILLRILAAKEPTTNYNTAAQNLCKIFNDPKYQRYTEVLTEEGKRPFGNYIKIGLHQKNKSDNSSFSLDPNCNNNKNTEDVEKKNFYAKETVLHFALQYANLKKHPESFDPDALQKSAQTLNSVLNPVVDALNYDIEDLFIKPTLARIQSIVSEFDDVSYAEVGKTNVAGLNGLQSVVSSKTVSAFDETGPLRLNELISEAGSLNSASKDLLPNVNFGESTIPVASLVSVVSALSKDRSLWRGLTSGVSLTVTPSVLADSESAELKIDLTTAPTDTQEKTGNGELRPLSRISQNKVNTSVYVNTLDLFPFLPLIIKLRLMVGVGIFLLSERFGRDFLVGYPFLEICSVLKTIPKMFSIKASY